MPKTFYQPLTRPQAEIIGENLKRLHIAKGWTLEVLAEKAELNVKTILALKKGRKKPHPETVAKLATAFEVPIGELLDEKLSDEELFDRKSNPEAAAFVDANPRLFKGWTRAEFAEFFSRFGVGGGQTDEGARAAALHMNDRRKVLANVAFLLETPSGDMLRSMIEQMVKRERVTE